MKKWTIVGLVVVVVAAASLYILTSKKGATGGENELKRQQLVEAELALTVVEPEVNDLIAKLKDFPGITDTEIAFYRDGVKKLMEAAPIIKLLYQKQIGASPNDRIAAATDNDRELIDRYGHPWCMANSDPLCVAVPTFLKKTSTVIPDDLSCDEANKMGSPFEAIVKKDGKLTNVPYSQMWPEEQKSVAAILKSAAGIFANVPREEKFVTYLNDLAATFGSIEPHPYAKTDLSWTDFLSSDSLLFARIGADEVGGDELGDKCESKARYHFIVGLRNEGANEIVGRLKPVIEKFEKNFSDLVNDPVNYVPRNIQVQLPLFLDVLYANGDSTGGPNGTTIGQTLPNWCGPDGNGECMRGTMIYVNKTVKAYGQKIMEDYIKPLFDEKLYGLFNTALGLDAVVYHEMFHNLGPRESTKKPNSDETYGERLTTKGGVSWKIPLEELKAQTGSMFMATLYYKDAEAKHTAGEMDDATFEKSVKNYREHMLYEMSWSLRMILRGSRGGPEFTPKSAYSKLAAVVIGFLTEQGALTYDDATKKWSVDFDKMPDAVMALMKKTGSLYISASVDDVEKFFLYYIKGDGEKLLHRDRILEVAGKMPSVLFDYQIKGL